MPSFIWKKLNIVLSSLLFESSIFAHLAAPKMPPIQGVNLDVKSSPARVISCKKRDILEKVKDVLNELENPAYEFPIPKARLVGEKCECAEPKYKCEPPPGVQNFKPRPAQYW
ncbi:hypothetical protein GE061_001934 [Apolygus lucorum]|uniref:Uncharacterized protein n=1 Tax=Apolygus lucorum TaxID=248454 RepID=A0A8S9X3N3_APOLU|nr:hypothetical protein GE061_001934 [Apolygus lucorum]